jgi:hypothetical protein
LGNTRALPLLILVLFLVLQATNTERYAFEGNAGFEKGYLINHIIEGEVNYNNSGEVYRDGVIDNFKNFKNMGYPAESSETRVLF